MDIKVITIGEPDINILPEDTQQYFYEAILTAIEKLYTEEHTQTEEKQCHTVK